MVCIGSALCCAGHACCKGLCCCCSSLGIRKKNYPKVAYVVFSLFWVLIAFILMWTFKPVFDFIGALDCPEASGGDSACFGTSAVLRMSFSLVVFHVITIAVIYPKVTCSSNFHDGLWCIKFILVLAFFICCLFIPNSFF